MIEFTVNEKENGRALEKIFASRYSSVPYGVLRRALRKRDVKVNGVRTGDGALLLHEGDVVIAYIDPDGPGGSSSGRIVTVYENDSVMLVEKPQGLLSEPDASRPGEPSLIELVRAAGEEKGEDRSEFELCHRLDRNTGGLIFISRRPERTETLKNALNGRFYRKIYAVKVIGDAGEILPLNGSWRPFYGFLGKRSGESLVTVADEEREGFRSIETHLRLTGRSAGRGGTVISELEAMLITGRTHQIRAHLAHLGFPVAGDGKYGREAQNRLTGLKYQALWAARYEFDPERASLDPEGILPRRTFVSEPRFR